MLRNKWVGGRLGSLGLLGDNQPIGLNLLLPGSGAADDWADIGLVGLVFGATIEPKRTKSQFGVQNRVNGGESVSQSPLIYRRFSIAARGYLRFSLPLIAYPCAPLATSL
jgi:hypothetical protein